MRRKNKKRPRTIAINFQAEEDLLSNLEQVKFLSEMIKEQLFTEIKQKGYIPVSKPKIIPLGDLQKDAAPNAYTMRVDAIYVGKKKAREENNES